MYFLAISLSCSIFVAIFVTVSELFSGKILETFIINFMPSQITSCFYCFLNCSFWISFKYICSRLLSIMKKVLAGLKFYLYFYRYFYLYI